MRRLPIVTLLSSAVVLLSGCEGATGPEGEPGAVGPPGPGVVWKDAAGTTVPGAFLIDPFDLTTGAAAMGFVDSEGYVWKVDPYSGAVSAGVVYQHPSYAFFASDDCSGTAYASLGFAIPSPRVVFEFGAGSGVFKAVPDTTVGYDLAWHSVTYDGSTCESANYHSRVIPLSSIAGYPALTPPSLGAVTPPFHLGVE